MSQPIYKKIGNTLWIHFEGRTFTVEAPSEQNKGRSKSKAVATTSGLLRSPMPGRILKVLARPTDKVSVGQTVAVIEAMKMEYSLKAPFEGVVGQVFKKSGDSVLLDEKILEIKKRVET